MARRLVKLTRDDGLPGARPAALYLDRDGALLVSDWEASGPSRGSIQLRLLVSGIRFEMMEGSGPASALARSTTGELWMEATRGPSSRGSPMNRGKEIGAVQFAEPGLDGVMWFGTRRRQK